MSAQVAADLRAAADVLERDGWTQGSMTDPDGCHCAAGAILLASEEWLDAVAAFSNHLNADAWPEDRTVTTVQWNDAPGRTADEVIAALRAAADCAEAEL